MGSDDHNYEPGLLSMASTMCNVGCVYLERKKHDDAIAMFEEALTIQEEALGSDDPLVIHTLDDLAYSFSHDSNLDSAMKHTDVLDSHREMLGSHSLDASDTLIKMTCIHVKSHKFDEARKFLYKILKIQEKCLSRDAHDHCSEREVRDAKKLITLTE